MRKSIGFTAALVIVLFQVSACSKRVQLTAESNRTEKGGIVASANWLKDKGSKYDIQFSITNNFERDVIINLHDISCSKGSVPGTIKHTFFNTGERRIDLKNGESKNFNFVCRLSSKTDGPYKVTIRRVYDNPTGDGIKTEKVLVENIVWQQGAAE